MGVGGTKQHQLLTRHEKSRQDHKRLNSETHHVVSLGEYNVNNRIHTERHVVVEICHQKETSTFFSELSYRLVPPSPCRHIATTVKAIFDPPQPYVPENIIIPDKTEYLTFPTSPSKPMRHSLKIFFSHFPNDYCLIAAHYRPPSHRITCTLHHLITSHHITNSNTQLSTHSFNSLYLTPSALTAPQSPPPSHAQTPYHDHTHST